MAATASPSFFGRLWSRYLVALRTWPIRTKMIQSGAMYIIGDSVAQFGVEGRRIDWYGIEEDEKKRWSAARTARLTFYGTFVFAPLAHFWLGAVDKVKFASAGATLISRLALDMSIWSPWVCFMFPTALGVLEGRSVDEVQRKVHMAWFPTYSRAVCVFGPTQVINYAFVPVQHRILLLQSVGLCWNVFLSWSNTITNRRLAEAAAALQAAQALPAGATHDGRVKLAEENMRHAEDKREQIRSKGDEINSGTRMGWA